MQKNMYFLADAHPFRRAMRCLAALCVLFFLTACSKEELYGQLSEQQANEVVAVLRNAGLVAEKSSGRDGSRYAVRTSARDFARAVSLLKDRGLPSENFDSLGQMFKKEGFVSSPLEERARLIYALSQELSRTLSAIDGVVQARVHLTVPEKNPLANKAEAASASVLIRHRENVDMEQQKPYLEGLIVRSIEGLEASRVAIVFSKVETVPLLPGAPSGSFWGQYQPLGWIVGILAVLALLGSGWAWWLRASVSPSKEETEGEKLVSHQRQRP